MVYHYDITVLQRYYNYDEETTMEQMQSLWVLAGLLPEPVYCEACGVVPLQDADDKYCDGCTKDMLDYLAVRHEEQAACDKGLY